LEQSVRTNQFVIISIIIAVLGLAVAVYATMHHLQLKELGATDFACNINQTFSCDEVAKSKYSELFGIPLGVWGFSYFASCLFLLISIWKFPKSRNEAQIAYSYVVPISVLVSIVLGIISLGVLKAVCITCLATYALTLAQAGILVVYRENVNWRADFKTLSNALTIPISVVLVCVVIYNFAKPEKTPKHQDLPQNNAGQNVNPNDSTQNLSAVTTEIPINRSAYSGLGEDYRKGTNDPKVMIVEFADFQCPACKRAAETLADFVTEFGDKIQVVYKNFPLDSACNSSVKSKIHPQGCRAAILARCAGQINQFWAFHDKVFNQQSDVSDEKLNEWAKEVGLNDARIKECLESKDILAKIADDVALAEKLGVNATPSIFLNGHKFSGGRFDELRPIVEKMLSQ
jgi:protein-disulfide isomerase